MGLSTDEIIKLLKEVANGLPLKQVKVDDENKTMGEGHLRFAPPEGGKAAATATASYTEDGKTVKLKAHWVHLGQGSLEIGQKKYPAANVALGHVTHGPRLWAKISVAYEEAGKKHVIWLYYDIIDAPFLG